MVYPHLDSFFNQFQAWMSWISHGLSSLSERINSFVCFVARSILSVCHIILGPNHAQWHEIFVFDEQEHQGSSMVCRFIAGFGICHRVQGSFIIEQYGETTLYRLLFDGDEVIDADGPNTKGNPAQGSILLPDGIKWKQTAKKAKSNNTTNVRGRSVFLAFEANLTGLTALQLTLIHDRHDHKAKETALELQSAFEGASVHVNKHPHPFNNY
ncbi:hypothetical protein SEMRO_675_G185570.1 [Seminavis robusta]|uniref:Uncharacterized protein n=1 Tax=Seminavis robusta TaxID=568900 RepID=A0A9N8E506_9STRA|nr:hypothetical protein SEMRO_675_G185570.1 [Seminavis robusta]|eukprot:Sro675_g185570.1 n/a (212) ;mRNA; r:49392-50027